MIAGDGGGNGGGRRRDDPDKVGDLLSGLFRKWGLQGELERQDALERWPEIVGEAIAKVARPRGIARGVLYVEVRSSAWMNELEMMRHEFLRRLNAGRSEGRIERIVFLLAERPDRDDPPPSEERSG